MCRLPLLVLVTVAMATPAFAQLLQPPTVGCASDGQLGPKPAPGRTPPAPHVPAALAPRLAFYATEDAGVLGPRGWKCFGLYGSNGSSLYVLPALPGDMIKAQLGGPGIELAQSVGDTSGRFEAARVAARLFPARKVFVDRIVAEGMEKAGDFPTGPGPHDQVRRLGADRVGFETAAGEDGIGTSLTRMVRSRDPIQGVAIMDDNNDATVLAVRLPPTLRDLAPAILAAAK